MNDRLWRMKVVMQKVRKFICWRNENEFSERISLFTTTKPLSECLSAIHLLRLGTISEEALNTRYFGTIETC